VQHYRKEIKNAVWFLHEDEIDHVFRAVVESTQEAILNSMITAQQTIGRDGNRRQSLKEHIHLDLRWTAMNSQKRIIGEQIPASLI
jgi:D-aminopeptidase